MKEIIRCAACSRCARVLPAGFTSDYELYCIDGKDNVDKDDGCTFGSPGEPMNGTAYTIVDIADRAAVNGWH